MSSCSSRESAYQWQKYSMEFQKNLKLGDLLEFQSCDSDSFWGMYYVHGQVAHFVPTNSTENIIEMESKGGFVPGEVRRTPLDTLAGESELRVNNKPEKSDCLETEEEGGIARSVDDSFKLMIILHKGHGFFYSPNLFNSKSFVTFLKFEGPPESTLKNLILGVETGNLDKIWEEETKETILKKLVYMQWWENTCKTFHRECPRRVLELGMEEWSRFNHSQKE